MVVEGNKDIAPLPVVGLEGCGIWFALPKGGAKKMEEDMLFFLIHEFGFIGFAGIPTTTEEGATGLVTRDMAPMQDSRPILETLPDKVVAP